jgi:acetyltransferase-like isoleucine patch superfamily enzyme
MEHERRWRELAECGSGTSIHDSVVICNPRHVRLGSDVTIEPLAVLMGAPEGELRIGSGTLIAPHAYLQGVGGLRVGAHVGVGAGVLMLTAVHAETPPGAPITAAPLRYGEIDVAHGCDLGVGSILLPGTRLGAGVQVGAGAVGARTTSAGRPNRRSTGTSPPHAWRRRLGRRPPHRVRRIGDLTRPDEADTPGAAGDRLSQCANSASQPDVTLDACRSSAAQASPPDAETTASPTSRGGPRSPEPQVSR